jgi:D-alanyl-D-alanine carboxypeptidase/D-alanyl-D-alanine-endopeptidase (penicillin-binding protein 4)
VREVTGDLIGETTFFHSPPNGFSWTVDDTEDYYGAEISALTLYDNFTQISVAPGKRTGEPCALKIIAPFTGLQLDSQTITVTNGVALERGEPMAEVVAGFQPGLETFAKLREPFLLYH